MSSDPNQIDEPDVPSQSSILVDPQALADLRQKCHDSLLSILLARGASLTEAEDLLADLWADCVPDAGNRPSLLEKFSGKCTLQGWLATVATNRWIDLKRRQARRSETNRATQDDAEHDPLAGLAAEPVAAPEPTLVGLLRDSLRNAFARCPAEAVVLLRLVYLHGLTQREVMRMLGWSEWKVSRFLTKAMSQIELETLRAVRQRDPWLQLSWEDFVELCQTEQLGFL